MASTLKRLIGVVGASAIIAGTAIVAAPAAQADGEYYGTWTLTAIREGDKKAKCTGEVSDSDTTQACPGGQTLTLKTNYRYRLAGKFLRLVLLGIAKEGTFDVPTFPSTGQQALILESDSQGILALGSAWSITLSGGSSGSPTKMTLVLQTGFGEITLVFRRDAA